LRIRAKQVIDIDIPQIESETRRGEQVPKSH